MGGKIWLEELDNRTNVLRDRTAIIIEYNLAFVRGT